MTLLHLPIKGIYFDQIRDGSKTREYRLFNPYWKGRLVGRAYDGIVLTRGYPKAGGVEGVTRLSRAWHGFTIEEITHPHFGPDPVRVFAIDVSEPQQ